MRRLKCVRATPMLMTADLFYSKDGKLLAIIESVYRGDHFKIISTKVSRDDRPCG